MPLPPMSKIYNSSYRNNKPAELFRKDLISAMKLADSEPLEPDNYWLISDGWKQEWERGVQVPVNPEHLPLPLVKAIKKRSKSNDFKLPPNKFLRCSHDEFFSNELHILTNVSALAEKTCRYDLDSLDQHWLKVFNEERKSYGLEPLPELTMEIILEDFENQCFEKLQREIQAEQGLGIEYDEDVVCDVCRSPDSEEGNEMVFCDQCNLCVHQACYGIQRIPTGSWVCRTCALGIRPPCVLCPARGGAMKSTRSGQKWTHVSCALWVPEVSIGCVEKMEPITKISQIPPSRWALTCCLCRERMGACIQCSVKACKRAYHVTCAFENSLEMKAIIDENPDDEVKLKSYCPKHSKKKEVHRKEVSSDDSDKKASVVSREGHHQREVEMTNEERDSARAAKIQAIESEFYKHVSVKETAEAVPADPVVVDFVFNYWTLKRKANHDKPLLTPLKEETDRLDKLEENSLYSRVKMFVHLRQDLERVRNLCYMVSRREKIAKSFIKVKEDIFEQQVAMLKPGGPRLSDRDREAVILAGQSEHIYDRLASEDPTGPKPCLRLLLEALEGREVANLYGLVKKPPSTPTRLPNPYAKQYFNGLRSRRLSLMGGESEGSLAPDEDSQGTADSTAAEPPANTARGALLETLCEEEPAEEGLAAEGQAPSGAGEPAQEAPQRAGQQVEPAEDASSPTRQEARKDDHGSSEGRISTRSRKHEVATDASNEGTRHQELGDTEGKAQTRGRRLGSVESLKGTTCRGEAKKDELGDTGSRTPTRNRRLEADEFVKSPSLSDRKSEPGDARNGTSLAGQRLETAELMQNSEAKKNEQKEPGSETPTRSRRCDTKAEPQREQVERESKALYRSRRHERKVEDPEEQVEAMLRREAKREESKEPESRSSSRSRRLDIKCEPPKEAAKTLRSKMVADEIEGVEYKPSSVRGRQPDLGAEVAEEKVKSSSRNDARKGQCLETECRMSSRSRRAEARVDGSDDRGGSEASKEGRKNSELENRGRTTRQSEARNDVPQAVKEVSENQSTGGEADDDSSRTRRLRNRRAGSIERREVVGGGQSSALAAICEFPEELNDVARCTRSSTMPRQEDGRALGDDAPQGPAEGRPVGEGCGKRSSDENVPRKSERRERRDSVPCSALLPEALSPPRASSLSGYRIPKRAKAPNGLLEDCRGSSPVSPLHEVPSHCYTDGYTRGRSHVANLRRLAPHCEGRPGTYVERWKHDLDFATGGSLEVKENGSRYSMRYRPKCGRDS